MSTINQVGHESGWVAGAVTSDICLPVSQSPTSDRIHTTTLHESCNRNVISATNLTNAEINGRSEIGRRLRLVGAVTPSRGARRDRLTRHQRTRPGVRVRCRQSIQLLHTN